MKKNYSPRILVSRRITPLIAATIMFLTGIICEVSPAIIGAPLSFAAHATPWAHPGAAFMVWEDVPGGIRQVECSVGFPGWDQAGNHYFITASHCFRDYQEGNYSKHYKEFSGRGLSIYNPNTHWDPVGYEILSWDPHPRFYDAAVVKMFPGKHLSSPGWTTLPITPITGTVGNQACSVGAGHIQPSCGLITRVQEYPNAKVEKISEATYCSTTGDSGGAVYNSRGALGIHTGSWVGGRGSNPCVSAFLPIVPLLHKIRATIPTFTM